MDLNGRGRKAALEFDKEAAWALAGGALLLHPVNISLFKCCLPAPPPTPTPESEYVAISLRLLARGLGCLSFHLSCGNRAGSVFMMGIS